MSHQFDGSPANQAALIVDGIHKQFRGNRVLRGASFEIVPGRITALIGSNGAGKSTLLDIISGLLPADAGRILVSGHDVTAKPPYRRAQAGLARTFQHPRVFRSLTVRDCMRFGAATPVDEGLLRNLLRALPGMRVRQVTMSAIEDILHACRLTQRADRRAADLTYGEQKFLMLAQVLASDKQILCFDELCAGLEGGAVQQIAGIFHRLARSGKTILFIEHNLQLVRQLAEMVIFLHQGVAYRKGAADAVLRDREVVRLYLGA